MKNHTHTHIEIYIRWYSMNSCKHSSRVNLLLLISYREYTIIGDVLWLWVCMYVSLVKQYHSTGSTHIYRYLTSNNKTFFKCRSSNPTLQLSVSMCVCARGWVFATAEWSCLYVLGIVCRNAPNLVDKNEHASEREQPRHIQTHTLTCIQHCLLCSLLAATWFVVVLHS